MDCSLPGSSVHGILQARTLEWVAISFSRRSSGPRNQTCISCIGRRVLYHWVPWEAHSKESPGPKCQLSWVWGTLFWSYCCSWGNGGRHTHAYQLFLESPPVLGKNWREDVLLVLRLYFWLSHHDLSPEGASQFITDGKLSLLSPAASWPRRHLVNLINQFYPAFASVPAPKENWNLLDVGNKADWRR